MEHLPLPSSGEAFGVARVPYIVTTPYDGGDFLTYPRRTKPLMVLFLAKDGVTSSAVHETSGVSIPKPQLESFLQAWLFFGLLHEIFGDLFVEDQFVVTEELPYMIDAYRRNISGLTDVDWIERYSHADTCLGLTKAALVIARLNVSKTHLDISRPLRMCIATIAETISWVFQSRGINIYGPQVRRKYKGPHSWTNVVIDADYCAHLIRQGWCPSATMGFAKWTTSLLALIYFSALTISDQKVKHGKCSESSCLNHRIDDKSYQTLHMATSCCCEMVYSSRNAIISALLGGTYPLVRVRKTKTLDVILDVVPAAKGFKFVAISHVWADGMGNSRANALRACVATYLRNAAAEVWAEVSKTTGVVNGQNPQEFLEVYIWIDTLCVPIRPSSIRKLALQRMPSVYLEALAVLVVDRSLSITNALITDPFEVLARILISPWCTRLWTLQEATLADDRLWFLFSDTAIILESLQKKMLIHLRSLLPWEAVADDFLRRGTSIQLVQKHRNIRGTLFALVNRTTSKLSDEAFCIATLLGLNLEKFLSLSLSRDSMEVLWTMIDSDGGGIPARTIFATHHTLGTKGFGWAPASFLDSTRILINHILLGPNGILTNKGLMVHFPALQLSLSHTRSFLFQLFGRMAKGDTKFFPAIRYDSCEWLMLDLGYDNKKDVLRLLSQIFNSADNSPILLLENDIPETHRDEMRESVNVLCCLTRNSYAYPKLVKPLCRFKIFRSASDVSEILEKSFRLYLRLVKEFDQIPRANDEEGLSSAYCEFLSRLMVAVESDFRSAKTSTRPDLNLTNISEHNFSVEDCIYKSKDGLIDNSIWSALIAYFIPGCFAIVKQAFPNTTQWIVE